MDLVYLLSQLVGAIIGHAVVFYGFGVFPLVVVGQANVVVEIVMINLVFLHLLLDPLVSQPQSIENVTQVFMRLFVLSVFLNTLEIPFHCFRQFAPHLLSSPYVVITRNILRRNLNRLLVPPYRLVVFFSKSIGHPDLIQSPSISRIKISDSLQYFNFFVEIILVTGQNKKGYSVLRLNSQDSVANLFCFDFVHEFILVDIG